MAMRSTSQGKMNLPRVDVVHRQRGRVHRHFGQIFPFAFYVGTQAKGAHFCLNGFHQLLYQRTLNASPVIDLVDKDLAVFAKQFRCRAHILPAPLRHIEDVAQVGVEGKLAGGELLIERVLIELADGKIHFVHGDIGIAALDHRVGIAEPAANPIHVEQLLHRAPALISLPPVGAGCQPYREGLGEVFVGMLLRVPALHVPHELTREGNRLVAIAVRPPERSEALTPFLRFIKRVGVVESVAGLMPHVHHDLPRIFNIVHLRFKTLQFGIGEVKRDSDDRLHVRAAPLIRQVALRAESMEPLGVQLFVELKDKAFEGRAFQFQAKLPNRLGKNLLDLCRRFFEIGHRWSKRSIRSGEFGSTQLHSG